MKFAAIRANGSLGPQQGEVIRVDGFPGRCRTLHTVSMRSAGYIGPAFIEVSMMAQPTEDDWRTIYRQDFAIAPETIGVVLRGKYVWLRVRFDDTLGGEVDSVIIR